MTHPDEALLVAHVLGDEESPGREDLSAHLLTCATCRDEVDELRRVLAATAIEVPARGPDYAARVWARLEPRLGPASSPFRWRPWLVAAAAVLIAVSSLLVGRWSRPSPPQPNATEVIDRRAVQQRVVMAALGEHLDRTERALTEISNTDGQGDVDLGPEQAWARDLLEANRLYRNATRGAAPAVVVDLLTDIEPILLEIVNSPRHLPPDELRALQARIESRSLLFKLRVTGAGVRDRQPAAHAQGVPQS